MMAYDYPHPVSRTYQYKKITKPLLERKRRARINKCLDELKNLMIDALETEGEDISKLEKADILELTVRHLQRLQGSESCGSSSKITKNDEVSAESRWISGFGHCAAEAYRFLSSLPGEGAERLARHLAAGLQKCRQSNSSLKANLLTQILASLDLTTDSIATSLTNATAENTRIPFPQENSGTYHGSVTDRHIFTASYQCSSTITIIKNEKLDTNCTSRSRDSKRHHVTKKVKSEVEDDEEIDVERIDEADPMWRPW